MNRLKENWRWPAILVLLSVVMLFTGVWYVISTLDHEVDFTHADVVSALPAVENWNCHTVLGEFSQADDLLTSHMEGALGVTEQGFTLISGFSHYLAGRLMASPRVDRLASGTHHWVAEGKHAPTIISHIQGATYGNTLWIAGGFVGQSPGVATHDVWIFDTQTSFWTKGPRLPSARASGGFVEADGRLHYISGLEPDRETGLSEHISLDAKIPMQWHEQATFPRPRNHFQAVSIGGLIYAVGGMSGHEKNRIDLPYLDVYHPEFRQWLPLADMPQSRSHAEQATFVYQNRIIVAGGRSEANIRESLDSIVEYNPYTNEWRQVGTLPAPNYAPLVNIVNGQLYVAGGGLIWKEPVLTAYVADISTSCD